MQTSQQQNNNDTEENKGLFATLLLQLRQPFPATLLPVPILTSADDGASSDFFPVIEIDICQGEIEYFHVVQVFFM